MRPGTSGALLASLASVALSPAPRAAVSLAERSSPRITSRARLLIAIGDGPPQPLTLGLYGELAPASVALFEGLCAGTLASTLGSKDLTYAGSSVSRIERDKLILGGSLSGGSTRALDREIDGTGYVRTELVNRADAYANADANGLSHDRAGLLSMRRGGGAFEFGLTPAANTALDATRIVIGEVSEGGEGGEVGEGDAGGAGGAGGGGLRLVAALNAMPARQPSVASELGGVAALYGLRGGLGFGFAGLLGQVRSKYGSHRK